MEDEDVALVDIQKRVLLVAKVVVEDLIEIRKPKKVLNIRKFDDTLLVGSGTCPNCNQTIFPDSSPYYCRHKNCGQALEWDL